MTYIVSPGLWFHLLYYQEWCYIYCATRTVVTLSYCATRTGIPTRDNNSPVMCDTYCTTRTGIYLIWDQWAKLGAVHIELYGATWCIRLMVCHMLFVTKLNHAWRKKLIKSSSIQLLKLLNTVKHQIFKFLVCSKANYRSSESPFSNKMHSFEKGQHRYTWITKIPVKFTHIYGKITI